MEIVTSVTGRDYDEVISDALQTLGHSVDIIEWRADYYDNTQNKDEMVALASEIKKKTKKPIIFTLRSEDEGGLWKNGFDAYRELNIHMARNKVVEYVDIEIFQGSKGTVGVSGQILELMATLDKDVKIVGSYHDFKKTPSDEELRQRLAVISGTKANVSKVAVMPQNRVDVVRFMDAVAQIKKDFPEQKFLCISMGRLGSVSRVIGEYFGSCMTFGEIGEGSAPGQIFVDDLKKYIDVLG